ncbi:MAG: DUF106 domain-containing protein [DPANN group archaeon]|nr:DUF106 domain-containing protein [DPANN group archaeon]
MGLFNFLDPILNFLFDPLLSLGYLAGLLLITFIISVAIVLIYKYATDQRRMKELKATIKQHQEKLKALKDSPGKMMAEQKKMMSVNMELMKHSMKPTLYTFIPIIIIFGWLATHFAFMPLLPGAQFNVTATFEEGFSGDVDLLVQDGLLLVSPSSQPITDGKVVWTVEAQKEGVFSVFLEAGGNSIQKEIVVSSSPAYITDTMRSKNFIDSIYGRSEGFLPKGSPVQLIQVSYEPVRPLPFRIFGWQPGWLGTYIIFSLLFSITLRKLLKVN